MPPEVDRSQVTAVPDGEPLPARAEDPWARIAELDETVRRLEQRLADRRPPVAAFEDRFVPRENLLARQRLAGIRSQGAEAAERLLRSIFDSLEGRMCIIAADGRILATNVEWNETFPEAAVRFDHQQPRAGASGPGEEIDLTAILGQLPSQLAGAVREAISEVVDGDSAHGEARGSWHGPGGPEDVIFRLHKVRDHDRARAVVVMVDVTESLRTRERLREVTEQAHLLAMVAQHMDNSVFILDPQGAIEWVNDAFTRTTGYRRADLAGQDQQQLTATLLGDVDLDGFAARLQSGRSADLVCQVLRKDGTPYWMELRMQPLREPDRPDRLIGVLRDITERRRAEEQITASQQQAEALAAELSLEKVLLAKVLNSIPHLVYWKDAALRYDGVNDAFLRVRECGPAEQVLGRLEAELPGRDALNELLPPLEQQVMADGRAVENVRITLPTGSGPPRQLFLSVLPQSDEHGRVRTGADRRRRRRHPAQPNSRISSPRPPGWRRSASSRPAWPTRSTRRCSSSRDNVRFVTTALEQVVPALRRLASALAGWPATRPPAAGRRPGGPRPGVHRRGGAERADPVAGGPGAGSADRPGDEGLLPPAAANGPTPT